MLLCPVHFGQILDSIQTELVCEIEEHNERCKAYQHVEDHNDPCHIHMVVSQEEYADHL